MQKAKIEELKKEGWEILENYGRCYIMGKRGERMLYCPKTGKVILQYRTDNHLKI